VPQISKVSLQYSATQPAVTTKARLVKHKINCGRKYRTKCTAWPACKLPSASCLFAAY